MKFMLFLESLALILARLTVPVSASVIILLFAVGLNPMWDPLDRWVVTHVIKYDTVPGSHPGIVIVQRQRSFPDIRAFYKESPTSGEVRPYDVQFLPTNIVVEAKDFITY